MTKRFEVRIPKHLWKAKREADRRMRKAERELAKHAGIPVSEVKEILKGGVIASGLLTESEFDERTEYKFDKLKK